MNKNTCPQCNGEDFVDKYDEISEEVYVECTACGWTIGQWDDDYMDYVEI